MKGIKKTIVERVSGKSYTPSSPKELFHQLDFPSSKFKKFNKAITSLIRDQKIEILKGKVHNKNQKKALRSSDNQAEGTISIHPRGFGFVEVQSQKMDDVFIPKNSLLQAMDGDTVRILFFPGKKDKGPEGKVTEIIKRNRAHFVALITKQEKDYAIGKASCFADEQAIHIDLQGKKVSLGDRVVVRMQEGMNKQGVIHASLEEILGSIEDASQDVIVGIKDANLRESFPRSAVEEAKKFGTTVDPASYEGREDFTKTTTVTIDPKTAKDFDDAITIEKTKKGIYVLGVHIADVAHYVKVGSSLDQEALLRCNSTYFPGQVVPMIPFELSNELCSLKPDVVRLTMSVVMHFDASGDMVDHRICRSYIKSDKRFSYEEAKEILDGKKSPFAPQLFLMEELAYLLKKKRKERGSIEFGLPEAILQLDDKGEPTGVEISQYDITHQMIEEFMLKANETVATFLTKKKIPAIYRIHEEPTKEDYNQLIATAKALSIHLPSHPSSHDIAEALNSIEEPLIAKTFAIQFIRAMKLAIYSTANIGHFGLALEYYCHFTSPIRRYSDLVIQRLLTQEKPASADLETVAHKISDQERKSAKAESSVLKLKKIRFLKDRFQKSPQEEYHASIIELKNNGIIFEIEEILFEGFLPLKDLPGYFVLSSDGMSFVDRKKKLKLALFSKLTVRLEEVDLISQKAHFKVLEIH